MSQRGQATIEVMAIIPACLLAAWTLVETGVLVRERVAVGNAAGRAAVAHVEGADPADAARGATGEALARRLKVSIDAERVTVTVRPRVTILGAAGIGELSSSVELEQGGAR